MGFFDIFKNQKSYKKALTEFMRQQELISPVVFLSFNNNHSEILDEPEVKKLFMVIYFYGTLDGMAYMIDEKKELNDSIVLGFLEVALSAFFKYSDESTGSIISFTQENFNERWFRKIHSLGAEAMFRFWNEESRKEHPNLYKSLQVAKIFDDSDLLIEALPHLQKQLPNLNNGL